MGKAVPHGQVAESLGTNMRNSPSPSVSANATAKDSVLQVEEGTRIDLTGDGAVEQTLIVPSSALTGLCYWNHSSRCGFKFAVHPLSS